MEERAPAGEGTHRVCVRASMVVRDVASASPVALARLAALGALRMRIPPAAMSAPLPQPVDSGASRRPGTLPEDAFRARIAAEDAAGDGRLLRGYVGCMRAAYMADARGVVCFGGI